MFRIDITECDDTELSLNVFNTESLWVLRRDRKALREAINRMFVYNIEQLDVLNTDLDAEKLELFL